jgi:hypothetical protein
MSFEADNEYETFEQKRQRLAAEAAERREEEARKRAEYEQRAAWFAKNKPLSMAFERLLSVAPPELKAWMEQYQTPVRAQIRHVQAALAEQYPEKAEVREATEDQADGLTVLRKHLPKIERMAADMGIEVQTFPVDKYRVMQSWLPEGFDEVNSFPIYSRQQEERAAQLAKFYATVYFTAPAHQERIVGVAKLEAVEDKKPVAVFTETRAAGRPIWTPEMMRNLNFQRCDACNAKLHRTTIYLVLLPDGQIKQYGGTCAKHLNLAVKLRDMLKALAALKLAVMGDPDMRDGVFGGGRIPKTNDVKILLLLLDRVIRTEGYKSRKEVEIKGGESTAQRLGTEVDLLSGESLRGLGRMPPDKKAKILENVRIVQRYVQENSARGDKLMADAKAFVDEEVEKAERLGRDLTFAMNMRTALITGSPRTYGFLAYIVEALRRKEVPPVEPYTPEPIDKKLALMAPDEVRKLAEIIGPDEAKGLAAIEKIRQGKGAKAALAKLANWLPGIWTCTRIREWETQYGTNYKVYFARADGAAVMWSTGKPHAILARVPCDSCDATGEYPANCPTCVGPYGARAEAKSRIDPNCATCKGTGEVPRDCYTCGGTGKADPIRVGKRKAEDADIMVGKQYHLYASVDPDLDSWTSPDGKVKIVNRKISRAGVYPVGE